MTLEAVEFGLEFGFFDEVVVAQAAEVGLRDGQVGQGQKTEPGRKKQHAAPVTCHQDGPGGQPLADKQADGQDAEHGAGLHPPAELAPVFVYLASDESKYVTGIELSIDGGILAGSAASPKKR